MNLMIRALVSGKKKQALVVVFFVCLSFWQPVPFPKSLGHHLYQVSFREKLTFFYFGIYFYISSDSFVKNTLLKLVWFEFIL